MRSRTQRGFTLLEIAVLILIVGLILAGVVKGQEMITSAKVKRLAGQIDEIRAAYFGFQDRYKALPGDYAEAALNIDCGGGTCLKGDGDGRIRADDTPVAGSQAHEDILVWTHLSASGLLKGEYRMVDGESLTLDTNTPRNPYSAYLQIVFDGDYGIGGGGVARHQIKTGPQIPVEVVAELDRKTDDGKPYTGAMQFSGYAANGAPGPVEGPPNGCTTTLTAAADWNLRGASTNCGAATHL